MIRHLYQETEKMTFQKKWSTASYIEIYFLSQQTGTLALVLQTKRLDTSRGRCSFGQWWDSGARLVSLADRLQHPRGHLLTWYSSNGHHTTERPYIAILLGISEWKLPATKSAEIWSENGFDHNFVRKRLKIHLANLSKSHSLRRINVAIFESTDKATRNAKHYCPLSRHQTLSQWRYIRGTTIKFAEIFYRKICHRPTGYNLRTSEGLDIGDDPTS